MLLQGLDALSKSPSRSEGPKVPGACEVQRETKARGQSRHRHDHGQQQAEVQSLDMVQDSISKLLEMPEMIQVPPKSSNKFGLRLAQYLLRNHPGHIHDHRTGTCPPQVYSCRSGGSAWPCREFEVAFERLGAFIGPSVRGL